jgi:predicted DNA-binding transcriptional regulator YafY
MAKKRGKPSRTAKRAKQPKTTSASTTATPVKPTTPARGGTVTAERAARLYQLLQLLGTGPQTRDTLIAHLSLDVRGFYRDLEVLRTAGIPVSLQSRNYVLEETVAKAVLKLPFPDPHITLGEAQLLAKGRSASHRKLKEQLEHIMQ